MSRGVCPGGMATSNNISIVKDVNCPGGVWLLNGKCLLNGKPIIIIMNIHNH